MKRSSYLLGSCVLCMFAALATMTGCGSLECAEGTVAQDGECVLEEDFDDCGDGEILKEGECIDPADLCEDGAEYDESNGVCIVTYDEVVCGDNTEEDDGVCVAQEPKDCGPGTELDVNSNECVPTEESCGEGTEFTDIDGTHVCLPTDEVCDDGTEFVEEYGLCFPDFDCQPGDVVIDGYCVPEVTELVEEADYTATGNTNPDLGGSPVQIDVADAGESVIFTGVIGEPEDVTGNGELDQIVDVFEFEAEEGDWFEISVRAVGMPNPAFAVQSVDAEDGDPSLERYSAVGTGQDKIRQIVIPADGTYEVTVLPEALLSDGDYLIGDDEWDYVGTLELLETPEADEHEFLEENLEGTIGKLSDNFIVASEFEAGEEARFVWEREPKYADAVATVWASPDEFIGEYDDASFSVEVPESEEFFVIFDWESKYGNAELDYEVSAEDLLFLDDGEEVMVDFDADDGDVLYVSQDNDSLASVDVTVTDEADAVIVDTALSSAEFVRYINLVGGEYEVIVANNTGDVVEALDVGVDVVVPEEIADFEATYSSTVNEHIAGEQDYYLVEVDERSAFEIDVDRVTGPGFAHLMIYEIGDERVLSEGPSSIGVTAAFEFEADTTYVFRIGGEYSNYFGDYDYDLTFADLTSVPEGGDVAESFSADDGDVVEITQTNYEGAEVTVTVTDDATGDEIFGDTLSGGGLVQHYPMESGDYTATFVNDGDAPIYELETSVAVLSPIDEETFSADAGDVVRISQSNGDGTTVDVFVTDTDGEVVASESLSTLGDLLVDIESDGEHTVWYFRSGEADDEQEVADIDFTVEVLEVFEDEDDITEPFTADAGDVLEIRQDSETGQSVEVTVSGDEGQILTQSLSTDSDGLIRYIGLDGGDYDVNFENDSGDRILEFESDIDVISPQEITDFEATYSGTSHETWHEEQSFYSVEFAETTVQELTLTRTADSGYARIMIYALGDEELDRLEPQITTTDSPSSMSFEFEEDTQYVIRVGNDGTFSSPFPFDYTLEFDELDVLSDGEGVMGSFSAEDGDVVEITQSNQSDADVELTVTDDDSSEEVLSATLGDGETVTHFPFDEGDYTAEFENATGEAIVELEPDVAVYSPIEEDTFSAEAGDDVRITQSNDDGTSVDVLIVDEDDEVVAEDSLDTFGSLEFGIGDTGDYTIWYYQSGEPVDEQEADNIEFTVGFLQSTTLETVSAEMGDVIEIDRDDAFDDDDVFVAIVDGDGETLRAEMVSYSGFFRYVGLEQDGDYDVEIGAFGEEAPDPEDYTIDVDVVESEVIDDTSEVYEGSASEDDTGPQDFYLIELGEATTYDVTLTKTDDDWAYGRVFIYALDDDQLERSGEVTSEGDSDSISFEFEVDTPYVIRVGNDASYTPTFDYELSFQ